MVSVNKMLWCKRGNSTSQTFVTNLNLVQDIQIRPKCLIEQKRRLKTEMLIKLTIASLVLDFSSGGKMHFWCIKDKCFYSDKNKISAKIQSKTHLVCKNIWPESLTWLIKASGNCVGRKFQMGQIRSGGEDALSLLWKYSGALHNERTV